MRAINTPSAYGLLQSVFDRIHDEFVARIVLSTKGGAGVEYHEAWHYVSLLLLTPAQRDQIYSDYVKEILSILIALNRKQKSNQQKNLKHICLKK